MIFHLEAFDWELALGSFHSVAIAWALWPKKSHSRALAWEISFRSFRLGTTWGNVPNYTLQTLDPKSKFPSALFQRGTAKLHLLSSCPQLNVPCLVLRCPCLNDSSQSTRLKEQFLSHSTHYKIPEINLQHKESRINATKDTLGRIS